MKIEEIKSMAEQILACKDFFLVELKLSKDNVIELFIDGPQGVGIQHCIEISRELESLLDREKEDFELTVSSAGIGCPFKVEGQFKKNLNKRVEIKLKDNTLCSGILKAYSPSQVTIECEEKKMSEGKKKKETVKVEKTISRNEMKEIKDTVVFGTNKQF